MNDDFSNLNLYLRERKMLFLLRFKKKVPKEYFEDSFQNFLNEKLIAHGGSWFHSEPNPLYHLTDRYFRYCVYRRSQFFNGKAWSCVLTIITAMLTTILTKKLGL